MRKIKEVTGAIGKVAVISIMVGSGPVGLLIGCGLLLNAADKARA